MPLIDYVPGERGGVFRSAYSIRVHNLMRGKVQPNARQGTGSVRRHSAHMLSKSRMSRLSSLVSGGLSDTTCVFGRGDALPVAASDMLSGGSDPAETRCIRRSSCASCSQLVSRGLLGAAGAYAFCPRLCSDTIAVTNAGCAGAGLTTLPDDSGTSYDLAGSQAFAAAASASSSHEVFMLATHSS